MFNPGTNTIEKRDALIERINELTGWIIQPNRFQLVTDTTEWMNIFRGHVLHMGSHYYVIRGNMTETRFGINEQPKYWVFSAIELESGKEKIIKTVFHEEFTAHIGIFKIRCYRSPEKESEVLHVGRHDERFMQGFSCYDKVKNNVRVIDYIRGTTFFDFIPSIKKPHKQYFIEDLPGILRKLKYLFEAIQMLHRKELCHGDIRNDHIMIDQKSDVYKWIDFDLKQDVSDFDMWSLGNILSYAVAKGIITFESALKSKEFTPQQKESLTSTDGSAFYQYRIINLSKLFDYIPPILDRILKHFTIRPIAYYAGIDEFIDDYHEMLEREFS